MPTLKVTLGGFGGDYATLNGEKDLELSQESCIKFAETVGLSTLRQAHDDETAVSLAAYRALAVKCCLDFSGEKIRLQPGYPNLESSEKGNISYWIGMTIAAALADAYLKVPQLIHASQFDGYIQKSDPASKSLADLVGKDIHGKHHVIEAKGRARVAVRDRCSWKAQAKTVATVDDDPPATRSYCVARINKCFRAELVDPSSDPLKQRVHLSGGKEAFGIKYYQPFIAFLENDATHTIVRNGKKLAVRVIAFDPQEDKYVFVGLTAEARDAVKTRSQLPRLKGFQERDTYVGNDGVVVTTGSDPCKLP